MKYLLLAFAVMSLFAACKKEDKKKCWTCMETTATHGTVISVKPHHDECGKSEVEIGQYLQSTRISLDQIPEGDTVNFINSCGEKK